MTDQFSELADTIEARIKLARKLKGPITFAALYYGDGKIPDESPLVLTALRAYTAKCERVSELLRFNNEFEERARKAERRCKTYVAVLEFYAKPEIYKPHPHGPAFDRPDLSYAAKAALGRTEFDAIPDADVRNALRTAIGHIEHMCQWITETNKKAKWSGEIYSFESISEDMPGIRAALDERPANGDSEIATAQAAEAGPGLVAADQSADANTPATPSTAGSVREALEPFAREADVFNDIPGIIKTHDNVELWQPGGSRRTKLTIGDLRRARAAFEALSAPVEAPVAVRKTYIKPLRTIVEIDERYADKIRDLLNATARPLPSVEQRRDETGNSFQSRVRPWMLECFGPVIPFDKTERNHRFLEEAIELVQSLGCSQSETLQLVDYVFGRPEGDPNQEVGGVMVTLAALCLASDLDMAQAGETELARIWTKVEQIRAKQAAKPKHSPLPGPSEPSEHAILTLPGGSAR